MQLQEWELAGYKSTFQRFAITTETERRAAILCKRGESEMFAGNIQTAELLFEEARELAPQSAYVLAMVASFELGRNSIGAALDFVKQACDRANKATGALCYAVKARALGAQGDRVGQVGALARALDYDPMDVFLRHRYGVALSRASRTQEAIAFREKRWLWP